MTGSNILGALLRAARQARGLSTRGAATACDCSAGAIRHWEEGRRLPSDEALTALATAYGLDQGAAMAALRGARAERGS